MERFYKNVFIMFKKIMVCILLLFICLPVNVLRADAKITPRSDEYGNPIVTSVKSNAWGKTLQAGDTIHFSVTLDEEYDGQELELDLRSTKDSVSDMEVELDYVEDTKSYDGDFTIPQETYASEWYVCYVCLNQISDDEYSSLILNSSANLEPNCYFYVEKNNEIDIPNYEVNINYLYINEKGEVEYVDPLENKEIEVPRRTTLKELGVKLPTELADGYSDLKLLNWEDDYGTKIDENTPIISPYLFDNTFYANYDKEAALIKYVYPNQDQQLEEKIKVITVDKGTTYSEIWDDIHNYKPSDIYDGATLDYWEGNDWIYDDIVKWSEGPSYNDYLVDFDAIFNNKVVTTIYQIYYDSNGKLDTKIAARVIDEGTTYQEMLDKESEEPIPNGGFDGLRFSKWNSRLLVGVKPTDVIVDNYDYNIEKKAEYENCLIKFELDEEFRFIFENDKAGKMINQRAAGGDYDPSILEPEFMYITTAEIGDTVTIYQPEGYKDVRYCYLETAKILENKDVIDKGQIVKPGDQVQINENATFIGDENLAMYDEPLEGEMSREQISTALDTIMNAETATNVVVDMDDAVIIPKEILSAAKDKNVNLTLNMNGYQWNIVGNTIMENAEDVNLEVLLNTDNIPSDIIAGIADNQESIQLSLTYEGEFGFEAWLSFDMGKENVGKVGSLYYYDGESLNYQSSNRIDEDGVVSFKFNHASDYVIITDVQKSNVRKQLTSLIEKAEAIEAEIYTEDSYFNLQRSIAKADEILADLNSTVDQINAAYNELDNAINKLEKVELNFDSLKQEIILVEKIVANIDDYIPSTVVDLEKLLNDAKVILSNAMNQEEIDAATKTLREARLKATLICDKKALLDALDEAYALEKEDFTKDSWALYEKEVEAAQTVADDETVSQDEVDKAVTVLVKAKELLVKRGNTSELSALIGRVETLNSEVYTANTWKLVESALKDAKAVLANADNVSDAEVKEVEESLKNAVNNLVLIDNEKPETDDSNKPNQGNTDKFDTNESEGNSESEKNDSTETSAINNIGGYIVAIALAGVTIEVLRRRNKISE